MIVWKTEYVVNRTWSLGRWRLKFEWRCGDNTNGRFGGGWNWQAGFQLGDSSLVLNLLFCSVRVWRSRREADSP